MVQPPSREAMTSLFRYFSWSQQMLMLQDAYVRNLFGPNGFAPSSTFPFDPDLNTLFLFQSYWFSSLYVVIEGWNELGLSDPDIDQLIDCPSVDLLRRHRNGTFHFQKEYFAARFMNFIEDDDASVG